MASVNGIIVSARKAKNKEGVLAYKAELSVKTPGGTEKIAEWRQLPDGRCRLFPEEGYSVRTIMDAVSGWSGMAFDTAMYDMCTVSEYERLYRAARRDGFSGLCVAECDSWYIGRTLTKEEAFLPEGDIESLMSGECRELAMRYPGEKVSCRVFAGPLDFIFGEPANPETLKRQPRLAE